MRSWFLRAASVTCVTLVACGAVSLPAGASRQPSPLAVAQAAYKSDRASHGKLSLPNALLGAALKAHYNLAIYPDGYLSDYDEFIPHYAPQGYALLVSDLIHGGFSCVHVGPTLADPPSTSRCPAVYFAELTPDVRSNAKFRFATQVSSAIGLGAQEAAKTETAGAVSSAVPKILMLVSGVSAARAALDWTITTHAETVCLSFSSKGSYLVSEGTCR